MPLLVLVAVILVIVAVSLDLFSLVLRVRRNKSGVGSSGVPGLSWLIYLVCYHAWTLAYRQQSDLALRLFLGATVFHLLCQFGIPALHKLLTVHSKRP